MTSKVGEATIAGTAILATGGTGVLIAVGIIGSGLLAAVVISLLSAWARPELFHWPHSLNLIIASMKTATKSSARSATTADTDGGARGPGSHERRRPAPLRRVSYRRGFRGRPRES